MANSILRIGTRESPLAVWQAHQVQNLLTASGVASELVYIKSEGDTDVITPLYALGVQGIFTKTLDAALLNNRIDIAVHSLKDVPVQMAQGIVQAAVLKRASYKDLLVYKEERFIKQLGYTNEEWNIHHSPLTIHHSPFIIATGSTRRIAQWLNRYPNSILQNLRGNVNTRLRKLSENNWNGAIFAAAGLERINLRPEKSVNLDWMLPAPAQGAIAIVCRQDDAAVYNSCKNFNDAATALCVKIERDFLKALSGGCSTPVSALAIVKENEVLFKGNVLPVDGRNKIEIEKVFSLAEADNAGLIAGQEVLSKGADKIIETIRHAQP